MKQPIRRALISVTDKRNLEILAKALADRGVEIVASGGTAAAIKEARVDVTEISEITGFPEAMDGRIKTLHPKIHGGILADRRKKKHLEQAAELGVPMIDLVVVNLYRFREAAENPDLEELQVVEAIDIGGPTLIRAAAKNHDSVAVVVDPDDYDRLIAEMDGNSGEVFPETRRILAAKAFHHTASYDTAIAAYFKRLVPPPQGNDPPEELLSAFTKVHSLRYGENPHCKAALYRMASPTETFGGFKQLQGKELSYNNINDMYAAFLLARDLGEHACAIIKHTNPCGAAACPTVLDSFIRAKKTDPVSAFGSVVSFNGSLDAATAEACREIFLEVIMARGFSDDALAVLKKKKNLRLITIGNEAWDGTPAGWTGREVGDLLLMQERDEGFPELEQLNFVTARKPAPNEESALKIAWRIAKHIRSNAIVICDDEGTIGVGAGQMSRVDSCRIAVDKAKREGLAIEGASAASDAFFPFPDGVEVLAEAGVRAIIQPGGSIRDKEVTEAAERLGITMALTGRRHFRH
jgi:phosphoribosylaminoimidazolecarboxamide formyltransferase/IMP cyclohydrolase